MQASLPEDLVPMGTTILLTIISTSCAIFLGIGQAIFGDMLASNLAELVDSEVAQKVVSAGVTQVREVVNAADLAAVLRAYSRVITQVLVSSAKP